MNVNDDRNELIDHQKNKKSGVPQKYKLQNSAITPWEWWNTYKDTQRIEEIWNRRKKLKKP